MLSDFFKTALLLLIICSCKAQGPQKNTILHTVGELLPNETTEESSFQICGPQDRIVQYYAFDEKTYTGEKKAIVDHFHRFFTANPSHTDSGLLRIRFVVNCKGESGRFHLLGMDTNYQEKSFDPELSTSLLEITKSLDGWKAMEVKGRSYDYYQYLIFKIEDGRLIEIMP